MDFWSVLVWLRMERVPSSLTWINGATLNYITAISEKAGKH